MLFSAVFLLILRTFSASFNGVSILIRSSRITIYITLIAKLRFLRCVSTLRFSSSMVFSRRTISPGSICISISGGRVGGGYC
jgi:hypothetical protein